jgi:thioredoxin-related protein
MHRSALLLLMLVVVAPASANPPAGYPFLRFDEAMQQANADVKLVFVYFGRYGCAYCDKTNKEAFSDPTVRDKYIGNYILTYVDSESGRRLRLPSGERITERELGTRYNAAVTPVFSFMTPDGTRVLQLIGLQSKASLLEADRKIQEALAGVSTQ